MSKSYTWRCDAIHTRGRGGEEGANRKRRNWYSGKKTGSDRPIREARCNSGAQGEPVRRLGKLRPVEVKRKSLAAGGTSKP